MANDTQNDKMVRSMIQNAEHRGKRLSKRLVEAAQEVADCHGMDSAAIEKCKALLDAIQANNEAHNRYVHQMDGANDQ